MPANNVLGKFSLFLLFTSIQVVFLLNLQSVKDKSHSVSIPNAVQMLERLRNRLLEIAGDTTQLDNKYLHWTTLKFSC